MEADINLKTNTEVANSLLDEISIDKIILLHVGADQHEGNIILQCVTPHLPWSLRVDIISGSANLNGNPYPGVGGTIPWGGGYHTPQCFKYNRSTI